MPSYPIIDQFAAHLDEAGLLIGRIDRAPWIDAFERNHGAPLRGAFGHLIRRNAFCPFEWGTILFFGNSATEDVDNWHSAARRDPAISQVLRPEGFIQIGRPRTGSYDPICLGVREAGREPPIVRLDHEIILIGARAKIVEEIAPSFLALAERLVTGAARPSAVE